MLAYAASRRRHFERGSSPPVMLAIAIAHVALVAAVMSVKMDLPQKLTRTITEVELIALPKPPPPPAPPSVPRKSAPSAVDRPQPVIPLPPPVPNALDPRPTPLPPLGGEVVGPALDPVPRADPLQRPAPVRVGPRFATPDHALRPPYPRSRLDSGEEASLRLRLAIDQRGRVTSVDPVGRADPAFLDAARRHIIARWRYQPATEDGRATASSTVITLRFELD